MKTALGFGSQFWFLGLVVASAFTEALSFYGVGIWRYHDLGREPGIDAFLPAVECAPETLSQFPSSLVTLKTMVSTVNKILHLPCQYL